MEPLYVSLSFYVSVFFLAEIARRVADVLIPNPGSLSRRFAYELIATAQMCTCVYENALIVKYYGLLGFFITVASLLTIGSFVNRGAMVNPSACFEAFFFRRFTLREFLAILLAEVIGGYTAFRWANAIWYWGVSHDHAAFYQNFYCKLGYKVPHIQACLYEIVCCFLIRSIIGRASAAAKRYVAAVTIAAFLSLAIMFVGVPGLNPIIASSRLQGCDGLTVPWFLFTYWVCPIFGFMLVALAENRLQAPVGKKSQ